MRQAALVEEVLAARDAASEAVEEAVEQQRQRAIDLATYAEDLRRRREESERMRISYDTALLRQAAVYGRDTVGPAIPQGLEAICLEPSASAAASLQGPALPVQRNLYCPELHVRMRADEDDDEEDDRNAKTANQGVAPASRSAGLGRETDVDPFARIGILDIQDPFPNTAAR